MNYVYAAKENVDKTEGRGPVQTFALFGILEEAVEAVQDRGVMGVGTGEVWASPVYESFEEFKKHTKNANSIYPTSPEQRIYGYRPSAFGGSNYGYLDGRDNPTNDPEWLEYIRLQAKLKQKYHGKIPE